MASEVDLCNMALGHLGDEAQVTAIKPPDGSVQSKHCGRFYPIARDQLLEAHPWSFATKRVALVANVDTIDGWTYAYAVPSKCLRPVAVLLPDALDDSDGEAFLLESAADGAKVLYTNVEQATLRYIEQVDDTTKFTPAFCAALGRLLASYLSGPILKGATGTKVGEEQMKLYLLAEARAKALDSNAAKSNNYRDFTPAAVAARGGYVRTSWR